ncbi:Glutamate 5-kinase [Lachnospiraceae bacterium TWA4]|nr:Glutamate 5-kinase [Lachnospiraceae bacterium TWA4]
MLVSSGAIAVGKQVVSFGLKPATTSEKQALAAIGQARLMMTYQRLFSEYNHTAAQVLLTKDTIVNGISCFNAKNTFEELFHMGMIPIVNENDTVATHEIEFGDNDRLSAIVTAMLQADLLILLSDIDGLYTDDPNANPDAKFISEVPEIDKELLSMGKSTSSSKVGTGGMAAKLAAAQIATDSGADMVIANGNDVENIYRITDGLECGTLFLAHKNQEFNLFEYIAKY